MLLAGIQADFGLDPRLKHSGVTWEKINRGLLDIPAACCGFIYLRFEIQSESEDM
jgi:hypothetical protein